MKHTIEIPEQYVGFICEQVRLELVYTASDLGNRNPDADQARLSDDVADINAYASARQQLETGEVGEGVVTLGARYLRKLFAELLARGSTDVKVAVDEVDLGRARGLLERQEWLSEQFEAIPVADDALEEVAA